MPNGPATFEVQQALQALLQGRNPTPLAPVPLAPPLTPAFNGAPVSLPDAALPPRPLLGAPSYLGPEYGGPSQVTEPPQAPLDTSILAQILAAQGPAPAPPAPASGIQRVANMLMGFGAGVQGQGPQFLAQLQEPQRRYEAQLQDYNANQSRLKLAGTEAMLRSQESKTRRAQELSDRDFEREFNLESRRLGINDQVALEKLRDALETQRDRERERAADERLLQQQKLKFGEDLGAQIRFYKSNGVSNAAQARRLALNDFADVAGQLGYKIPELTQADNAQLAKVGAQIDRLNRLSRGGAAVGGGSRLKAAEKAANDFEASKQAVISAIQRGDVRSERLHRRKMDVTFGRLKQFSDLIESGFGENSWPYQKPRGGQAQPAQSGEGQQQTQFNLNQPQGPSRQRQAAKAKLMENGYSDSEAEAELNRLGVR